MKQLSTSYPYRYGYEVLIIIYPRGKTMIVDPIIAKLNEMTKRYTDDHNIQLDLKTIYTLIKDGKAAAKADSTVRYFVSGSVQDFIPSFHAFITVSNDELEEDESIDEIIMTKLKHWLGNEKNVQAYHRIVLNSVNRI